MSLINEKDLEKLMNVQDKTCVSIFIPTQRAGKEVLEEKNKTHLKSLWKEVGTQLKEKGVSEEKIAKIEKPIEALVNDKSFWRHQSDGLAIFAAEDFFEKYTLPVNFEAHTYISEEFYIKPLVPMFNKDSRFYLLALQLEDVTLYEATSYSIGKVEVDDLIPSQLEERVGFDYKQKHLDFKTQNSGGENTIFHGHGGASDEVRKEEILKYFRAIDKGLDTVLHDEKVPLVIATQDYLFPIYEKVNTYNHLIKKVIPGNPSDTDIFGLHEKALQVLEPEMEKTKREKTKKFNELNNTDNTGASVTDILPAVQQGKVDTLFLENRSEIWGTYNKDNMNVTIHDNQQNSNYSLMNWAAKEVLKQGGKVFLIPEAQMPDKKSKMNALYRFN
ncbi:hypothetical protein SAMN05660776_0333 [Salegentibacter holothuriorum]|uniref:Uncharacterized protein n=1 Tax=Salegentibacter holothuriorum TaxID=241145 RepID=A0A1T5A9Y5_9FLAO|nr:hypothetical protein [Salegentibacter holothuriorum]SKB31748.1 hypothetical protein SAMN05660776_0333 [Salegentibacter holothuriorum]